MTRLHVIKSIPSRVNLRPMKMIQHTEVMLKTSTHDLREQGQGVATFSNKVLQGLRLFVLVRTSE